MSVVGKNIPHDSARGHVTGESTFLEDVPPLHGELLVGIVGSRVAHGKLIRVDSSEAEQVPGVVALLTRKDMPGHNRFGPVIQDEDLLVDDIARFIGHPVVLIGAETRAALAAAQKAVRIEMEELAPIFSIDDAIAANSFIGTLRVIERGDVAASFQSAERSLEGTLDIGGQEHFYLESQVAIAIPGDGGETITIHSSTQHPTEVQTLVAEVLGLPFNRVVVICKRMGGAFGGKETQAAQPAMLAALVAMKTRRAARFVYNKDDDMRFTGKRHPFQAKYKAAFTNDGTITGLAVDLHSNGGCSTDLSLAVMERALLHSDNAYFIPAIRVTGQVCKTNLPSNTAFRGFGGPQGAVVIENVIEEIAQTLGLDAADVRERNCYGIDERNVAPYGQIIRNNMLPALLAKVRCDAAYDARRQAITTFNRTSRTQLRGLATTAVKFGISFTRRTLNQANALVNIYVDGTVLVSTGGTEMGQGVNTRVRQLVADELGVSYDSVLVGTTATDKNNNTSPTAASSGTDLNGAAAVDACQKIRGRLAHVASRMLADRANGVMPAIEHVHFENGDVFDDRRPERRLPFQKICCQAYEERVSLGERGFYATPGVDFNRDTGKGHPFLYYTNGVACSEVLIDRFTGEMKVARVDLLMDIGQSINPGIDRGQIAGGFIQGMGWVTTEELKYNARGDLLSYSPTTYKIPNVSDLPEIFNISMIENPHNDVSIRQSKAVGEPPLLLGISVWAAVKNALGYVAPRGTAPTLRLPATGEAILLEMSRLGSISESNSPVTVLPASASR